jgi:hypothetical protein
MLSLHGFFRAQQTLNERVGLNDQYFLKAFAKATADPGALQAAGEWIDDMLKAISSELEELRKCTHWKHWSQEAQEGRRYEVKDVAAARKEVIDLLHFWISLAQILGMSPEMVSDMYEQKLAKNLKRQDDGYNIEIKDYAWQLYRDHPDDHPFDGNYVAESLEDLPDHVAEHYLEWAKNSLRLQKQKDVVVEVETCSRRGSGCKFCGVADCNIRRYESKLES